MLPLFKSHFSIGKSILTIDDIFDLSGEEVILVEDGMTGFRAAKKKSEKTGKRLRFGLRLESYSSTGSSKVIYFAKDSIGVDSLRRIYTKAYTTNNGVYKIDKNELKNVQVFIPFYDSYIHKNIHNFGSHELDLSGLNPIYLEEDNHHPYDYQIKRAIKSLKIEAVKTKSIYYKDKKDAIAFQFLKSVSNRKTGRKSPTYERPELNDFCSDEFCWESYKEKC